MIRAHDESNDGDADDDGAAPLATGVTGELRELLARLCDDQLTASDQTRLNAILDADASARRYYLKYVAVHSALAAMAGSATATDAELAVERLTLERFAGRTSLPLAPCDLEPVRSDRAASTRQALRWAAGISAMIAIAAASWWFAPRLPVRDASPELVLASGQAHTPGSAKPLAAEVTYVSNVAVWQNPNASFTLASRVRAGPVASSSRACHKRATASRSRRRTARWSILAPSSASWSTTSACRR
jgi:hypothetical protein